MNAESFKNCPMPDGVSIVDVQPLPNSECLATIQIDTKVCNPDVLEALLGVREIPPIQTVSFSVDITGAIVSDVDIENIIQKAIE